MERIVLTGFMGSGKSTVGRVLARQLRWQFVDLDDAVAGREGMSVPELFATRGESGFRIAETSALQELLQREGVVIALGGGAPETDSVRHLLATTGRTAVVHLHAPFPLLYARCKAQAQDPAATARPLLGEEAAAKARYERRMAVYTAVAHLRADASANSPEAVAKAVREALSAWVSPKEHSRDGGGAHHTVNHHARH
ncbi:MAG TPA: shikimate kinase [Acidobacteriaceae bacterium]|nr:shikimate kinase [Acidobacteriaceae bacterium]